MNVDQIRTMYDYAWWARDRLLAAADGMAHEEYQKSNGFTYNGLHLILAHALEGEAVWCNRFLGEEVALIPIEEVSTLATLKARWQQEEAKMRAFLSTLTQESLQREIVVRRRSGEAAAPLWLLLLHVVNHGTQHRSEAAEARTMVGRSPGSLDLTTFHWSRQ